MLLCGSGEFEAKLSYYRRKVLSKAFCIKMEESIKQVFRGGVGSSRDHEQLLNERQSSNLEPPLAAHIFQSNFFLLVALLCYS